MLQRIHALLAITQLTSLHSALQLSVHQLVGQASYAQYPGGQPIATQGSQYGNPMSGDIGLQLLSKELTPYVSLPSTALHHGGRTLGVEEEDKLDWASISQVLLDQAFPQTETSQLVDLTNKILTISNRYAPTTVTLVGLTHIHWDKELGNTLPFTFTVTDVQERQG